MSLDHTGSSANNPDTAGPTPVNSESPLVPISASGPSMSIHAGSTSMSIGRSGSAPASPSDPAPVKPFNSALASQSDSGLTGPSVSAPASPSVPTSASSFVSAPANPSISSDGPSANEIDHHGNIPPSDDKNADDQEQVDNPKEFIQSARQQRPRRHPLLGQRQAPFTGAAETYDYTQIFEEDEPYTEMGPSARVWKVYNQEIIRIDSDRIEDWRDGLDSLLVFVCKSYFIAFVLC
ncbi:hypothetical protein K435DRAFT_782704 [Dendrothele bispora CBS 962.96]|uniref:Uncharacterized protein n=1 Tax=Dendrothele bispora (strain CBS 962.96) TaxID=1314807 RepID=A0A4S8LDB0_DENBC|nr:hypothetical protein K435DRAFT_782704 [Dendrothele bispora CBS 962.96]